VTTTALLHPDLDRALDVLSRADPAAAAGLAAVLEQALASVRASPLGERAWHASPLTGDGFPVELAFSSADAVLRSTVAPWPDAAPARRLALAGDLVSRLGARRPDPAVMRGLALLQRGPGLLYGAWIGGRHGSASRADRPKVYAEVAADRAAPVPVDGPSPALMDRSVDLRMYGYDPAVDRHELYYRVRSMMPHHLRTVMDQAGLGSRAQELLDLLRQARGASIAERIPGGSVGFSFGMRPGGPVVVTLYLFARSLWGGDRRIRRGLLVLARDRGWALGAYEDLSAPLDARDVRQTYHGLIGFTTAPDRPIEVGIGLRPPPVPSP
jgi:hypothetical protein